MVRNKFLHIFFSLFIICLFSIVLIQPVFAFSGNGSGTSGDPYQITTCSQLQEMENNLSAYYIQENNIDCQGVTYTPVGSVSNPFSGTIDGQNYTIANLTISGSSYEGLIGVSSGATIKNMRIISGSITGSGPYVGSLVGWVSSGVTIIHSSSQASVNGPGDTGGLVGASTGGGGVVIQKSFYNGTLTSTSAYTGGIIGNVYGGTNSITDCYTAGTFTMNVFTSYFGGIAGSTNNSTTISNCYSSATLVSTNASFIGGIIGGFFSGTVSNSFSAATITGGNNIGGIFGTSSGISTNDYFDTYLANTGTSGCTSGCTAENSSNSNPNYFKGNNTNAPMNSWDFTNTWQINSSGYPTLLGLTQPQSVAPTTASSSSSSGGSASAPGCGDAPPTNSPNLFQANANGTSVTLYFVPVSGSNTGYYISYGLDASAQGYGTSFKYSDSSGVIPYTINALFPGTWYFKVRGQNGCMPGRWSQTMNVKVEGLGSSSSFFNTNSLVSNNVLGATTNSYSCEQYIVQSGDSLWNIANSKLGDALKYQAIMKLNSLHTSLIHTGQILKIGC